MAYKEPRNLLGRIQFGFFENLKKLYYGIVGYIMVYHSIIIRLYDVDFFKEKQVAAKTAFVPASKLPPSL